MNAPRQGVAPFAQGPRSMNSVLSWFERVAHEYGMEPGASP